jgi:hypothetical protein
MALQTSGAISLNDIHVEAGGTSGTSASINDSDIRGLIDKSSGAQMSFSEWYGADFYINLTYVDKSTANADSGTINYPTGTSSGDVIIACLSDARTNLGSSAEPSGTLNNFTQLDKQTNTETVDTKAGTAYYTSLVKVLYKVVASDTSTTFSLTRDGDYGAITLYSFTPSSSISTVSANSFTKDTSSGNDASLSTTESQPVLLVLNSYSNNINGTPSPATDFSDNGLNQSVILYDQDGTATASADFSGGSLVFYRRFNHQGYLTWS